VNPSPSPLNKLPWETNPLITEIRRRGIDTVRSILPADSSVSLLDLQLQVMLVACSYQPNQVWLGDQTILTHVVDLVSNDLPSIAAKQLASAIQIGKLALHTDLIAYITKIQLQRLEVLSQSGEPIIPARCGFQTPSKLVGFNQVTATDDQTGDTIRFDLVTPDVSRAIATQHHYLHTWRDDEAIAFGAYRGSNNLPFAWASFSKVDREYRQQALRRFKISPSHTLELTRAWNTPDAPKNSLSILIAYAATALQSTPVIPGHPVRAMISDINPNLGFVGSAFRASNFGLIASKPTLPHFAVTPEGHRYFITNRTKPHINRVIPAGFPLLPTKILAVSLSGRNHINPAAPAPITLSITH
jgi:hypothetical protein